MPRDGIVPPDGGGCGQDRVSQSRHHGDRVGPVCRPPVIQAQGGGRGMLAMSEKTVSLIWFVVWGGFSTLWCWTAAQAIGPTFDESFYIRAGLQSWHDLNHREMLAQGTMPLPPEVQTLPLLLAAWFTSADLEHDLSSCVPIARLGTIVFWWLLLWASYRLGSWYAGELGGRFAVA